MKDEFKGKIISEFVGLKSNMYFLVSVDGKEDTKAKGVNKNVVNRSAFKEFADVLFNKKIMGKEFNVNCIELELLMFLKFICLDLMIKDTY